MRRYAIFLLALLGSLSRMDGQEKDDPLQGKWTLAQIERGGKSPTPEQLQLKPYKVVIKGNTLRISDENDKGEGATFTRDQSKKPNEIDLLFKEGPKEDIERKAIGIYELDGDTLKLAWRKDGGPRPTEFTSIKGERTSELLILKRAKVN